MKSFSPVVAHHSSCLTREKNGCDGSAINNSFPYARLCHQVTIASRYHLFAVAALVFSSSLPSILPLGFDRARFHFMVATKTIRQKRSEGEKERIGTVDSPERMTSAPLSGCIYHEWFSCARVVRRWRLWVEDEKKIRECGRTDRK